MMKVTLLLPNDRREDAVLLRVPVTGEFIQLMNGVDRPTLVVLHVTHVEGSEGGNQVIEPSAIISVRPIDRTTG